MEVKGYKVFNPDWTCLGKKYTCPGTFEESGTLEVCGHGMHFCKQASDCFNYYLFTPKNHVAEVIARGTVKEDGDKCCTDYLEIVREVPWAELLTIVNAGKNCTGYHNSGNFNSGDWNKSSFNTGCFNTEEEKIRLFNKPSSWTYPDWLNSRARHLLNQIPKNVVEWVCSENMTDEEKAEYPREMKTVSGKWISKDKVFGGIPFACSNCGEETRETVMGKPRFRFCPMCGFPMCGAFCGGNEQ